MAIITRNNNSLSSSSTFSVANAQMKNHHQISATLHQEIQSLANSFYERMALFISQGQVRPSM